MKKPKTKSSGESMRELGRKWIDRITAAEKFEKAWIDDAQKAQDAYTGYKTDGDTVVKNEAGSYDFNILFANVETIVPAVINSPPVPDIRRRFGEADPAAKVVAQIIERAIQVQIDDSRLQNELEAAAQDAFLAGRGIPRLRFRSDITGEPTDDDIEDAAEAQRNPDEDAEDDDMAEAAGAMASDAAGEAVGSPIGHNGGPPLERVENERIEFEAVPWIDYRHGPAKRWSERPWEAFRFCIPREEANGDFFDHGLIGSQLSDADKRRRTSAEGELSGWEVWCKTKREVIFVDDAGIVLKVIPDPLGLSGFFSTPTPMQPIEVNGRLTPVNPFAVYRGLAEDLDLAVRRKHRLIDAMKAKGWYGIGKDDMASIIDRDDNEFVPISDPELWASNGGIQNAIAFWPIEKFIAVIQQLDGAIAQYKQWIYEITGISDIVRGASVASETATAQNIKSQWGSLRIQKMQRMMERTARDLFIMMAEIIPSKFTLPTLERMTGIPIIPQPTDSPEVQKQKIAVIELLKQPMSQYYRIDVESDSTVRADLTRQKQELASFLQGAAAYFAAVGPLVKEGTMPADAAAEIFAANARMFNLGRSVEDTLENMINKAKEMASQPPKPDPRQEAEQRKQAEEAAKAEAANAKTMADAQKTQADAAKTMADAEATKQQTEQRYAEAARKAQADGIAAQQQAVIDALVRDIKALERDIKAIDLEAKRAETMTQSRPAEPVAAHKPPSESIAFKDLPPEGQVQMAAQAGIILSPVQMAEHQAAQDAKEAARAAAKANIITQEPV